MPYKLKKKFEREYKKKGYTKKEADEIFFKWKNINRDKIKD